MKFHKIKVVNKPRTKQQVSKGPNTIVYLDGKPVRGVTKFSYEVAGGSLGLVKLEMLGNIVIDATLPASRIEKTTKEI